MMHRSRSVFNFEINRKASQVFCSCVPSASKFLLCVYSSVIIWCIFINRIRVFLAIILRGLLGLWFVGRTESNDKLEKSMARKTF